ncbi:MAG: hypothetical protein Kow0079_16870 [Vicingaceae bacterium]
MKTHTSILNIPSAPFGMLSKSYENGYRFGFQGQERDDEIKGEGNALNYKFRMHDPRLGRFFSVDPLFKEFSFLSPYVFGGNDPLRFLDVYGLGPGDRVKKAKSFVGTKYSQEPGLNTGLELRTGTSEKALEYLDCSELVCRVLAYDNITPKVQLWNTAILVTKLNDQTKFHKSDKPKVGDVFLWRTDNGGHTGIVTGVNADGTVEITHAKGTNYGTVTEAKPQSYFVNHTGWQGFFRPLSEEIESGPYANLSNEDLISKASYLSKRIDIVRNWTSIRSNIQEAKGNMERAAEIRLVGKEKENRIQQKLDNVNSEIEKRGIKNEETSATQ